MKVLAIMGSPRRGKSYQVTRMLEEKLRKRGDVEFEYVFLKDVHLEPCRGCHAFITPGEDACPLTDERAALVERMLAVNRIILVSPVCSQQVTPLMKGFILWDLVWFRMWRLTTWSNRDSNPCDYAYWKEKGWYTQNYYYREGISPLKNAVAALVERLMKRGLRSMYQGY